MIRQGTITTIPRAVFMKDRRERMELFREEWRRQGSPRNVFIVDGGDDIVCDACSAVIKDEMVTLKQMSPSSQWAMCADCCELK